jgi:5-methylcytosine-specific restriction endonuclease McrA
MKKCNKCLIEKSIDNFTKRKSSEDGLQYKCKDCERESNKTARQKNPTSKYYSKNKEYYKEYSKKWIENNSDRWKEYYKEWQKPYQQNKYDTDPLYRLRMCVGTRIRLSLNSNNKTKLGKAVEYLGCDYDQLKQYLESKFLEGMSWDNFGIDGWEMDHIIPLSKGGSFHYTNLQPLWWKDNRSKGSKLS